MNFLIYALGLHVTDFIIKTVIDEAFTFNSMIRIKTGAFIRILFIKKEGKKNLMPRQIYHQNSDYVNSVKRISFLEIRTHEEGNPVYNLNW